MRKKIFTKRMVTTIECLPSAISYISEKQTVGSDILLQRKFKFLAQWLAYKEALEFGEVASPPDYREEEDYLPIYSDYWWWLFRCLIKGWDYIQKLAKLEDRDIQSSPRGVFLAVLEEEFSYASDKILSDNSGRLTKALLQDWISSINAYLRKGDVNKSFFKDEIELENCLKNDGSIHFWLLYCLRNHPRNQNPSDALYYPWREFLKVWKKEKAWVCKKGSKRQFKSAPVFLQWVAGIPYLPDGSIPF